MFPSILVSVALFVAQPVDAEKLLIIDPNNHFIWPPVAGTAASEDPSVLQNNVLVEYGAPQQVKPFSWVSDIPRLSIVLWQEQSLDVPKSHVILDCKTNLPDNGTNTLYWDGELGQIDISLGNVMFLHAYECDKLDSWKFASHYFNLTKAIGPSSTSSSSSSTSLSLSATDTSTSPAGTPSPIPNTTTTPTNDSGAALTNPTALTGTTEGGTSAASSSPTTAVLAGGIGGGVAGGLLIAAIAFLLWNHCCRRGKGAVGMKQPVKLPSQQGYDYDRQAYGYYQSSEDTSFHQGNHAVRSAAPAEMYQAPPELAGDDQRSRSAAEMQ